MAATASHTAVAETCDVNAEIPPSQENPLPEFGDLFNKRQAKLVNNRKTGTALAEKKRQECKAKPLKDKCIPKELLLPFKEVPENAGRYLEFLGHTGTLRQHKGKVNFPGWLVELSDDQLQSCMDAKELLATGKSLCELMEPFYQAISALGADLSEEDAIEILRRVPNTSSGYSFSHFMFIAGNPWYAKKKDVLQEPIPFSIEDCEEQEDEDEEEEDEGRSRAGTSKKNKKKKEKNVVDRLYQLPRVSGEDDWPPKEDKPKKSSGAGDKGNKEYSKNEQLFYSALLYLEMYDTLEIIHNMYGGGVSVPEPQSAALQRQQQTGFGVSNIGVRKLGFAEWDRPLPPLPKISPYISDLPLVGKRLKTIKPNGPPAMYKRSRTYFQPLFLAVKAPSKASDPIKITEDGKRIKSILGLLASEGNCLAMLPNVHFILHLSDTLLDKLQETQTQKGPGPKKPHNRSEELELIKTEAKNLFRPHGLPKEIAKIPDLISFTDGIKLRDICTQIREQHWNYICQQKLEFREKVWQLMHVDKIPCGNLRESFVYSFQLYLPEKSHLPIVHDAGTPW